MVANRSSRRALCAAAVVGASFACSQARGQWQVNTSASTITFDTTVTDVNNGKWLGGGLTSAPASGQLDSDAWATSGWNDLSPLNFGGSATTGDHARGLTDGPVSTGGMYGYTVSSGNVGLGIQPGGSDWETGTLTLKVQNVTGSTAGALDLSYLLYVRNDQNRGSSFNLSYSLDNVSYTTVSALDYTSGVAQDTAGLVSNSRSTTITGLTLANNAVMYLRWTGAAAGGSGSRDEFVLDDITASFTVATGGPKSLLWTNGSADGSWNTASVNFLDNATPSAYTEGDSVTFTDTGAGTVVIQGGGVAPLSTIVSVSSSAPQYTFTGGGIGGSGGLTKDGAGTLQLDNVNSYTGSTNVLGGTLTFGVANALPTATPLVINNDATVDLNGNNQAAGGVTLVAGQIVGSGTLGGTNYTVAQGTISASLGESSAGTQLVKTGAGTVVMNGTHTYSGATSITSGGTLVLNGSLANTSGVNVNGALVANDGSNLGGVTSINGGGTIDLGGAGTGATVTSSSLVLNAGSNLRFDAGSDKLIASTDVTVNGGNLHLNLQGTAGSTYVIAQTPVYSGAGFTNITGRPSGVASVDIGHDGTNLTATYVAGTTGIGSNVISLGPGVRHTETFDSLANTGTANTTLPGGAAFVEDGASGVADETYAASDGSGTGVTGDTFSYGATDSTERALGLLRSGSNTPTIGFNVQNDTGAVISGVGISYVGEQWRQGEAGRTDKLDFQFSVDATSLTDGTWFDLDRLDFVAPISDQASGSAVDGNSLAAQVFVSGVIPVDVAAGSGIWFRWVDFDATGTDDGLAIDNLSVVPEPASLSLITLGALGLMRRRRREMA